MMALTLWRPWVYAVTHLGKPIENRTWEAPRRLVGRRFAIHAAKAYSAADAAWIEETFDIRLPPVHEQPTGVVATAVYLGTVRELGREDNPWYCGPVGWVFDDVVVLDEPIPCRGHLGLWRLPEAVARRLAA